MSRNLSLVAAAALLAVCASSAWAIDHIGGYTVRCAYLIPSDRQASASSIVNFKEYFIYGRQWYGQQMALYGFGDDSFRLETEADGVTPVIHVVYVNETAADLRGNGGFDVYFNSYDAALAAGVPLTYGDEIWFIVPETHVMNPDGTIDGGVALGGGSAAMCGSDMLAFGISANMTDDDEYDGVIHSPLGAYQMSYLTTYPWFTGATFSELTSSWAGALMHELGHSLTINHNFRNDRNQEGNLMGNGFRGFRGWMYPETYTDHYCRLSYASARQLSFSPYFTTPPIVQDNQSVPTCTITTSGTVVPQDGKITISFTAADPDGLAYAILYYGGDAVDTMELSGTSVSSSFATPYWEPDTTSTYYMSVWDVDGNRLIPEINPAYIYVGTGYNQAPRPTILLRPSIVDVDETVTLDSSWTWDDDYWGTRYYEWDVDGDGTYDIGPTTNTSVTTTYGEAGEYYIYLRVTDTQGGVAVSAPMLVSVEPIILLEDDFEGGDFSNWTDGGSTDWSLVTSQYYSESRSAYAGEWDNDLVSDNLDASSRDSITISFWYRDDDLEAGDAYLQLYNGASYVTKADLNLTTEDTWTYYETTIENTGGDAQYFVSNFRIKFEGSSIDRSEGLWIDDVLITAE